jgi:hypothetical protein
MPHDLAFSAHGVASHSNISYYIGLFTRSLGRAGFDPTLVRIGFVLNEVILEQLFPEYDAFHLSVSCRQCSVVTFFSSVAYAT